MLVIGGGPAGSAAARVLAGQGRHVLIADQRTFPRDKVCGDALISDTLHALKALGLSGDIDREAWHGTELRVYVPDGTHVPLRGEFACLPRERLDQLLLSSARQAGAAFIHATATAPLIDGGRVVGARLRSLDTECEVRARFTILATGGNVAALDAFGLRIRSKPEAVAGRAYYQAPLDIARELDHLVMAYDRSWCPGYGWIFPAPAGRFNIGVGLFGDGAEHGRLHQFFDAFCSTFPPAARLVRESVCVRQFRGAPIRSGLEQAWFGRRGLLAAGEAVATTYSATGEGIGKALESGVLAAEVVGEALDGQAGDGELEQAYQAEFRRRFAGRYRAYRLAQRWAGSALLMNVLARRARAGGFVQSQLESLLAERGDAEDLFSTRGLLRALFS